MANIPENNVLIAAVIPIQKNGNKNRGKTNENILQRIEAREKELRRKTERERDGG